MTAGWLALAGGAAAEDVVDPKVGKSKVVQELEDAEILLFQGNYDEAYRRLEHAREAIRAEVPFHRALYEGVVDILQAEGRLPQGYFSTVKKKLDDSVRILTDRAVFFAKQGATQEQLQGYNFKIGYAKLLLGDLAVADARVRSIIDGNNGSQAALKSCRPLYDEGIGFIRGTWNALPNGSADAMHARLMHKADLREVMLLVLEGDLSRAEGIFDNVEQFVRTKDEGWIRQFHPDGEAAAGIAAAGGNGAAPGQDEPPALAPARVGLQATPEQREAIRVALFYIELLAVKARLQLALKNLPIAEEAASLARDIAEERFPRGAAHRTTMLELAEVYLACHAHEVEEAIRNPTDVFTYQGRVVNVHQRAAESYLDDAAELVASVEQEMAQANASQPIHFFAADLRRRIAEVRKDDRAIQDAQRDLKKWADARKQDKPKVK